jgi:hypothetical protein
MNIKQVLEAGTILHIFKKRNSISERLIPKKEKKEYIKISPTVKDETGERFRDIMIDMIPDYLEKKKNKK